MSLSIYHTLTHLTKEEEVVGAREKEATTVGRSSYCFGFYFWCDYISEEVVGFSPFMVSLRKNTVFIVS